MASRKGWSEAGAARNAREMRATTVQYLRTSQTARRLEAGNLQRAMAIHSRTYSNPVMGPVMLFGGMGYQPPYPSSLEDAADQVVSDEAEYLADGELYVVEPHMFDIAVAAALTLTLDDLTLLSPDDLPSPTGVLVFPEALISRDMAGELSDVRALSWHSPSRIVIPSREEPQRRLDAVRITTYNDTYGPVQPPEWEQFLATQRLAGQPMPPLMLSGIRGFPFQHVPDDLDAFRRSAQAARAIDAELDERTEGRYRSDPEAEAEYAPGSIVENVDDLLYVKLLYAFWRLCEQRIITLNSTPVNHSATVTSTRARVSPQVRIVRLRRASGEHREHNPDSSPTWQHRWVVKMHKVRQWHPSIGQHKVLYRGPYVKGPEGKPLLGGETVRALVR